MEVAAGVTGFVCAVGQACQVAAQLHAFFTNLTNAPSQIQQLSEKLFALHSVLARINDVSVSLDSDCGVEIPTDVRLSLDRCLRRLEVVQGVVRKLDVNIVRDGTGERCRLKRNWIKVKWAFKEDEIAKICGDLDSEKSGLSLALQSLSLSVDTRSLKHMEGLQSSMAGLVHTSRQHTEVVKSHVDSRFVALERSLNTISGHIERANTQNMMPDEIMTMIQKTVTKSVQDAMAKAMFTGTTPTFGNNFSDEPFNISRATTYGGEEMRRNYSGSTLAGSIHEEDDWRNWKGWPEEMDDGQMVCNEPVENMTSLVPISRGSSKQVGNRYRHYRRLPTSLGLLLMFYTTSSPFLTWGDPGDQLSSTFEMGFTFIPAAWLFTTALSASFTKTTRFMPSPINEMNINFKSFNVVPTTADVMLYARLGNTLKLKEMFSQRTASPNDRDKHGRTPLHWAAAMGHVDTCALLLQNGADPTTPNEMARTPLHWTTFLSCNTDVIQLLISHGCDPDIPNVGGQSSLFSTGDKNYAAVLETMLNQEHFIVDIDQADNWGRTPLMWVAGSEKDENMESIGALLKKGASVTKTDKQGLTPLHLLMLSTTSGLNKKESMITLLRAGADPRASSAELGGLTPTDIAKQNGVLAVWTAALEACRLDVRTVMRKDTRDNEHAIIATAIGKVHKTTTAADIQSMNTASVLKRRRVVELDDDELELDDVKRGKIDEIPRRVQYQLFEGSAEDPIFNAASIDPKYSPQELKDYQIQLMALEQQNRRRLYRARAEQDNKEISSPKTSFTGGLDSKSGGSESIPTHTYYTPVATDRNTSQFAESNPSLGHSGSMESLPTQNHHTFVETAPTPNYCVTKIQCDNPPARQDHDISYSPIATPVCKVSMNEPSSCTEKSHGNFDSIRKQNDLFNSDHIRNDDMTSLFNAHRHTSAQPSRLSNPMHSLLEAQVHQMEQMEQLQQAQNKARIQAQEIARRKELRARNVDASRSYLRRKLAQQQLSATDAYQNPRMMEQPQSMPTRSYQAQQSKLMKGCPDLSYISSLDMGQCSPAMSYEPPKTPISCEGNGGSWW